MHSIADTPAKQAEPPRPIDDALWLAARGFRVFPIGSGERFLAPRCSATSSAHRIRLWWSKWPDALIAINTGKYANAIAFEVFGTLGERTLLELQAQYGELPAGLGEIVRPNSRVLLMVPRHAAFVVRQPLGPGLSVLAAGEWIVKVLRRRRPGLRLLDHVVVPSLSQVVVPS